MGAVRTGYGQRYGLLCGPQIREGPGKQTCSPPAARPLLLGAQSWWAQRGLQVGSGHPASHGCLTSSWPDGQSSELQEQKALERFTASSGLNLARLGVQGRSPNGAEHKDDSIDVGPGLLAKCR